MFRMAFSPEIRHQEGPEIVLVSEKQFVLLNFFICYVGAKNSELAIRFFVLWPESGKERIKLFRKIIFDDFLTGKHSQGLLRKTKIFA